MKWHDAVTIAAAGNFLPESMGLAGKGGESYYVHGGLCLETQNFPDFVHHANFPAGILHPGHTYRHILELRLLTNTPNQG